MSLLRKATSNHADFVTEISGRIESVPSLGFPIGVFPPFIQKLIESAEDSVKFHPDFFAGSILVALGSVMGNKFKLDHVEYTSKPALWLCLVGHPSSGKSHPMKRALLPLKEIDKQAQARYLEEKAKYTALSKEEQSATPAPKYPALVMKDYTFEKLCQNLGFNNHGVTLHQDELIGWLNSFGRYKSGGGGEMEQYLELFSGGDINQTRVTKDPIFVDDPCISILGGIQSDILNRLGENGRDENGFLERFLFVFPEHRPIPKREPKKIDPGLWDNYLTLFRSIYKRSDILLYADQDSEAWALASKWQDEVLPSVRFDHKDEAMQGKLYTYVWRIALILEVANTIALGEFPKHISGESMKGSIRVIEYFRANAVKVRNHIQNKSVLKGLTEPQLRLLDSLPDRFTRKQAIELAKEEGLPVRTLDRFLRRNNLFESSRNKKELKTGEYLKKSFSH